MKKILFVCNTYFQLITALQLKNTLLKHDYIAVLLSDHSKDAEMIVNTLSKKGIFGDVEYIITRDLDLGNQTISKKIRSIFHAVFDGNANGIKVFENHVFDELLYYNLNVATTNIFAYLYKNNPRIVCGRYEEGILSYDVVSKEELSGPFVKRVRLISLIRKVLGKKDIMTCTMRFYCYHPEYYNGRLESIRIPLIQEDRIDIKQEIKKTFLLDNSALSYKQKYIFFASVGDFEGGEPVGELRIAKKVSSIVGKDNLLVKVHPRDYTNAFVRAGLCVDENSAIPWEAIQLNYDFSNHVFLTVSSNSVLSINMMLNNRPKVLFLYQLCDIKGNLTVSQSVETIERVLEKMDASEKGISRSIYSINNENELISLLRDEFYGQLY